MSLAVKSMLWSDLSEAEKEVGVHPKKLRFISFNLVENELSKTALRKFFSGCRFAGKDTEFLNIAEIEYLITDSKYLQWIRTITEQVFFNPLPEKYHPNHCGHKYRFLFKTQESKKFNNLYLKHFLIIYHQTIMSSRHLMHPARRTNLRTLRHKSFISRTGSGSPYHISLFWI